MDLRNAIIGYSKTQARLNRDYELELQQNSEASASKTQIQQLKKTYLITIKLKWK